MSANLEDTIVALSSAPGPGLRAVVRLSGPQAFPITESLFQATALPPARSRRVVAGALRLPGIAAPLPADWYRWPGPNSYTGQDVLELHTLSSPPLVDLLIAELLNAGARSARPGEFTLRSFLAGKLDLTRAEAVLGVIEAGNRDELKQALTQLAGGMAGPLQEMRDDLLNLLADVEAGLDFAEEDIHFVHADQMLSRLARALAHSTLLQKQWSRRALAGRPFRVVLAGEPNAGKSSLFNALAGSDAALVSSVPGTTRDYLTHSLQFDDVAVQLIDTAGWQSPNGTIEAQARSLGQEQAEQADLILRCVDATRLPSAMAAAGWHARSLRRARGTHQDSGVSARPSLRSERATHEQTTPLVDVATKCDLAAPSAGMVATSATSGEGIAELRALLADKARAHFRPALAPSLSRCRHHIDALVSHLRQAHAAVLEADPPELIALSLRAALDELGEMVGAVYTEDLLDRIFSRFCIGK